MCHNIIVSLTLYLHVPILCQYTHMHALWINSFNLMCTHNIFECNQCEFITPDISPTMVIHKQKHHDLSLNNLLGGLFDDIHHTYLSVSLTTTPSNDWWEPELGLYALRRHRFIGIGIPIINLRWSSDRLRFVMNILMPVESFLWIDAIESTSSLQ